MIYLATLSELATGFGAALQPRFLMYALIGCALGTAVGVIPGIGPPGAIAILLPLSFHMDLTGAVIMLAAIYYGVMFGGSITSILINVPGEPTCTVATFDGYPLTQQGKAGVALTLNAVASFVGGFIAVMILVAIGPPLARWALLIGPPELFIVLLLAFLLVAVLGADSLAKATLAALLGLLMATVGMDPSLGVARFTFGAAPLLSGLSLAPVFMGLFGLSEVMINAQRDLDTSKLSTKFGIYPKIKEVLATGPAMLRGSGIGFVTGIIPGLGALAPTLISYAVEKRVSKDPSQFGKGAHAGVAGPESANNAGAISAFIPMLTLGIPGSATIAILMGAFIIHGVTPGPFLFTNHPDVVWPIIASMIIGNFILVVLNLPLVGVWVRFLRMPRPYLMAVIMSFMVIGSYSVGNSLANVWLLLVFGVVGFVMKKLNFPLAPLALTFVLGIFAERSFRRSLEMSDGSLAIFWTQPIARVGVIAFLLILAISAVMRIRRLVRGEPRTQMVDAE